MKWQAEKCEGSGKVGKDAETQVLFLRSINHETAPSHNVFASAVTVVVVVVKKISCTG